MKKYWNLIPGALLVVLVQWLAAKLVKYVPLFDALTLGIILGMLINNLLPIPEAARSGIKSSSRRKRC